MCTTKPVQPVRLFEILGINFSTTSAAVSGAFLYSNSLLCPSDGLLKCNCPLTHFSASLLCMSGTDVASAVWMDLPAFSLQMLSQRDFLLVPACRGCEQKLEDVWLVEYVIWLTSARYATVCRCLPGCATRLQSYHFSSFLMCENCYCWNLNLL